MNRQFAIVATHAFTIVPTVSFAATLEDAIGWAHHYIARGYETGRVYFRDSPEVLFDAGTLKRKPLGVAMADVKQSVSPQAG